MKDITFLQFIASFFLAAIGILGVTMFFSTNPGMVVVGFITLLASYFLPMVFAYESGFNAGRTEGATSAKKILEMRPRP